MKFSAFIRRLAVVAQATMVVLAPAAFAQTGGSPATHPFAQSRPIPGRYIVVFKNSVTNPA
ncbi:MAG: hypothetical protein ACREXV_10445, partial [Polaromonas sp.]